METARIAWKYFLASLSKNKREKFWREFAIRFIFESNAIEGSKLSQDEVAAIIKKGYVKKTLPRKEVVEVENAIQAFDLIRGNTFKLNQRAIIKLHALIVKNLDVPTGYKKEKIVVNNKETVAPEDVRKSMSALLAWYLQQKKEKRHPFFVAVAFHRKFEHIHPFADGKGRTGRLLLIWMLLRSGYGVILFKNKNKSAYFGALHKADGGKYQKLYKHCIRVYQKTIAEIKSA